MRHPDRVAVAAIVLLGLVAGLLSFISARIGPTVDTMQTSQTLDGTSVNTQIALNFTVRMNPRSVEREFHLSPKTAGRVSWAGNTFLFSPARSLPYNTEYRVTVGAHATDISGRHLYRAFNGTFMTQHEHIMYLGQSGRYQGRMVLASLGGQKQVMGSDDGSVAEFSASVDGSLVIYTRHGGSGERVDEIWLLSLSDGSSQQVFRMPEWNITQPHLSPDGRYAAFLATNVNICRKYYPCYRDRSAPLVYVLDLHTRKAHRFQSTADTPITDFLDFSPTGQLAYTDLGSALTLSDIAGKQISHVPDQGNALAYVGFDRTGDKAAFVGQTQNSTGGDVLVYDKGKYVDVSAHIYDSSTPSFSTSGKEIAYVAYRGEAHIEPIYGVNVYSFRTRITQKLTSEQSASDWAPRWSPDDRYIAFIRSAPQEAMYMGTGTVWVMRSDGTGAVSLGAWGQSVTWVN